MVIYWDVRAGQTKRKAVIFIVSVIFTDKFHIIIKPTQVSDYFWANVMIFKWSITL